MRDTARAITELEELDRKVEATWKVAHDYCEAGAILPSRRNARAEKAAADYRDATKSSLTNFITSRDASKLIAELKETRKQAEGSHRELSRYWKYIFTWKPASMGVYGLYKHGYARQVHGDVAGYYTDCLRKLERLDLAVQPNDAAACTNLQLLFGTTGNVDGDFEESVEVESGYTTTSAVDDNLLTKVYAKAQASTEAVVAKISAEIGGELSREVKASSTYQRRSSTKRTVKIDVRLGRPCYVYQMQTTVGLTNNQDVTLYGGYFISDTMYNI